MGNLIFFIALVFSQFYIFSSGLPQPAHFLFSLFFIIILFKYLTKKFIKTPATNSLIYFFIYVSLVNFVYFLFFLETGFLVSTIYILFGLFVFYAVYYYLILYPNAIINVIKSCFIGIISLFMLSVFSFGRFDFFPRYNAFFNDPNQMAFWTLSVSSVFFLLSSIKKINISLIIIIFFATIFIVFRTGSRSALLGLTPLILGVINLYKSSFNNKYVKFVALLFFISLIGTSVYLVYSMDEVQFVIDRFTSTDYDDQLSVRGYTRFKDFPQYLFFGAGQGLEYRFDSEHEMHSTWAGILFYYGIIGMLIFTLFVLKIFLNLTFSQKLIFLTPFFYGFSTFSARTPVFWLVYSVSFYIMNHKKARINNVSKPNFNFYEKI
jgi:hypothetical protein